MYASILTGKGYGAISSIMLYGRGAQLVLSSVFTPGASFQTGNIVHGKIIDGDRPLDDVVVGCEQDNQFVIHCHGNPVLVGKLVRLLMDKGVQLTDFENIAAGDCHTQLEKEARVEQLKAVTIEGVKIIQSQITGGLAAALKTWLEPDASIQSIQNQCREILERSRIARRIIHGVKIVLAGPANSGKSTLLNALAGSQKAVVSEIAGTTRDWVSAFVHLGPLRAEVIDTAGLGENALRDAADKTAQQRTLELIGQCDCVLWIEDGTNISGVACPIPEDIPIIHVLNKSDLACGQFQAAGSDMIQVSAKNGSGIEDLSNEIQNRLHVCDFDYSLPVVFTERQRKLLETILYLEHKEQVRDRLISFEANLIA